MDCFNNLVTYKKQCVTDGTSKYMIQNLPSITSDFAANIAGVDSVSGETLVNDAINFAANLISENLRVAIQGFTVPNSLFDSCLCAVPTLLSGVNFISKPYPFGIRIDKKPVSKYGFIKLNSLRILTNQDIEGAVITLEEADGGTTAINANLVANNYVEIELNYRIKTNSLKVYTEGVNLGQFPCFATSKSGSCGCNGSQKNPFETDQQKFISVHRYEGNTPNLVINDNTITGFQPCLSYDCDTDLILCKYKDRFALPLLYFTGAQILERSIINPRLNVSTITDIEQRQAIIKDYYAKGNEYLNAAAFQLAETVRQTKGDDCIVCTGARTAWATG